MVELFVNDPDQISIVESVLMSKNIKYEKYVFKDLEHLMGIPLPMLQVNGAPLDVHHALKWLETVDLVDIAQKRDPNLC